MRPSLALLVAAALFAASGAAQSMMEHAAAAAGAVGGTAGGKALSIGIDKIMGRAADTTSNAAAAKPAVASTPSTRTANPPAAANPSSPVASIPSSDNTPVQRRSRRRAQPVFANGDTNIGESQRIRTEGSETFMRVPTRDDFSKVQEGGSREAVLSSLGTPWSHVTIPDEGHLIEIMSWYNGRQRVGTVRLDNGTVVSTSF